LQPHDAGPRATTVTTAAARRPTSRAYAGGEGIRRRRCRRCRRCHRRRHRRSSSGGGGSSTPGFAPRST